VTAHPTADWTAQQLREAFPSDRILRYLLRDRDRIFGDDFRQQVRDMKIWEVSLRRARDWFRTRGALGPCDRVQRRLSAPNPGFVFFLLSRDQAASFAGKGLAGVAAGSAAGIGKRSGNRSGWRTAPLLRTPRGLKSHSVQSSSDRALAECAHVRAPGVGLLLAEVLFRFWSGRSRPGSLGPPAF
jgi:hypothetical protein